MTNVLKETVEAIDHQAGAVKGIVRKLRAPLLVLALADVTATGGFLLSNHNTAQNNQHHPDFDMIGNVFGETVHGIRAQQDYVLKELPCESSPGYTCEKWVPDKVSVKDLRSDDPAHQSYHAVDTRDEKERLEKLQSWESRGKLALTGLPGALYLSVFGIRAALRRRRES
jgi:hypothetical protein